MNGNIQAQTDPWFEEGFAEYFSSIEVDGKQARVGKIPQDEYLILQQVGIMKIADLFKVRQNSQTYNESGDHRTTFYAESGMLMHYIYDNQLMPKVAAYFDLKTNKHLSVEDAIRQAFGTDAAQFDKALRNYVNDGRYKYYPIPTPASIAPNNYAVKPLTLADGGAVLADIHLHSRDHHEQAVTEFQEILKSDPNNAAAFRGLGYAYLQRQDFHQAAEYFKHASQVDSQDPRVHYYSALLMAREAGFTSGVDLPAITRELETSIRLDPEFADSYALLAFAQATAGDPAKAVSTLQKAIAISPRNQEYRFNLANLYLTNKQPDQAIAVLEALRITDNPLLAERVNGMLSQVRQFKEMMQTATHGSVSLKSESVEGPVRPASVVAASSGPAKFLKGVLTHADCTTSPSAVLTVVSGTKSWKIKIADRNHLVLIGADEFSCSWDKQKVAVNYRETASGEGSVISLEIQ
jgi:cytochrome c-type biogenesis protein CcmH/NrfG